MPSWLIYGKRTGKKVNGIPVFDKQFRALNYSGVRVAKLSEAGEYAEKSDAEEVVEKKCRKDIDAGLIQIEIRKAK